MSRDDNQLFITGPAYGGTWTELIVRHKEAWDPSLTRAKTTIRVKHDATFVDIGIEEYTGESRRAKLCDVRLEEGAGRALLAMLQELYK